MKQIAASALILILTSCSNLTWSNAKAWVIDHRSQLEQTAYYSAKDVGSLAVKVFLSSDTNGKFSLANGLQSIEGNYTSPDQINQILDVWKIQDSGLRKVGVTIANDLANHPPKTKDEAVARIEGYVKGLQTTSP